jgi:hypothetical protein
MTDNRMRMEIEQMVEEDGDEVFVPIKSVVCCAVKLRATDGFWRCPKCKLSYGEARARKAKA